MPRAGEAKLEVAHPARAFVTKGARLDAVSEERTLYECGQGISCGLVFHRGTSRPNAYCQQMVFFGISKLSIESLL
jgi:hypothetical protein